jgi:predicted SAM-dependent methyltransferase
MAKRKIKRKIHLDVGCGFNKAEGYIGMDKRKVDGVDIVHDAEVFPWPLRDGDCAMVAMSHLIEHIKPWKQIELMDEVWRVLVAGGVLAIVTPHAKSHGYMQDPTHCSPWNETTPQYFDPNFPLYQVYRPKPYKIERLFYRMTENIEVAFRKIEEGGQNA